MKRIGLPLVLALAGCATVPPAVRPVAEVRPAPRPVPLPYRPGGLERVMGRDARALVATFGNPDADVQEGDARKLQFGGAICVLDAYLYPPKSGGEPVVTYVDARERDGSTIDRASCVAALTRREGGK